MAPSAPYYRLDDPTGSALNNVAAEPTHYDELINKPRVYTYKPSYGATSYGQQGISQPAPVYYANQPQAQAPMGYYMNSAVSAGTHHPLSSSSPYSSLSQCPISTTRTTTTATPVPPILPLLQTPIPTTPSIEPPTQLHPTLRWVTITHNHFRTINRPTPTPHTPQPQPHTHQPATTTPPKSRPAPTTQATHTRRNLPAQQPSPTAPASSSARPANRSRGRTLKSPTTPARTTRSRWYPTRRRRGSSSGAGSWTVAGRCGR
jgi:hypothetical protein